MITEPIDLDVKQTYSLLLFKTLVGLLLCTVVIANDMPSLQRISFVVCGCRHLDGNSPAAAAAST
jgi:hypothetical protein